LIGPEGLKEKTGRTAGVEPLLPSMLSAIPLFELISTEDTGRRPVAREKEDGADKEGELGPRAGKTKSGRGGFRSPWVTGRVAMFP